MKTIFDDDRLIESIHNDDHCITHHIVGANGITKIEAYKEFGERDHFPYLAIWRGNFLFERMPAIGLRIVYKEEASE